MCLFQVEPRADICFVHSGMKFKVKIASYPTRSLPCLPDMRSRKRVLQVEVPAVEKL